MTQDDPNRLALTLMVGAWRFTRHITGFGMAAGTASISQVSGTGYHYVETGRHGAGADGGGGRSLEFSKVYRFALNKTGVQIFHADPSAPESRFHHLVFTQHGHDEGDISLVATGDHLCGPDRYVSRYVVSKNGLSIEHRVNGPRKSYVMTTRYLRARA